MKPWLVTPILLVLALASRAQTPPDLPDPSPEEIETDLARRGREWLAWRHARSLDKRPGWRISRKPRVVVISSRGIVGSRSITHITNMGDLCQKWVLAHLGGLTKEKPPPPVIRICATAGEVAAFKGARARTAYDQKSLEIVVLHRTGPALLTTFAEVGEGLMRHALNVQSPSLTAALPDWLARGLPAHCREASLSKRLGFFFRAPRGEWNTAMRMISAGTLVPLEDLVSSPHEELAGARRNTVQECASESHLLVRFLTFGPGRKGLTRDFIRRLLSELLVELRERELNDWAQVMKKEALAEKRPGPAARRRAYAEHRARMAALADLPAEELGKMRARAMKAAFSRWKKTHWERAHRIFRSWIKNGLR